MRGGCSGAVPASVMAPADTVPSFDSTVLAWHSAAYWQHGTVWPLAPFRSPGVPIPFGNPAPSGSPALGGMVFRRPDMVPSTGSTVYGAAGGRHGMVLPLGSTALRCRIRRRYGAVN